MNIFLNNLVSTIGLATTIIGFIYVGRKLQVLDDLVETVEKMKHNLNVISVFLVKKFSDFNYEDLKQYSPFQLTKHGEEFIASLGFDKVFAAEKENFFGAIDDDAPKKKYDVEISAIKSIYMLLDEPYMDFLKTYLYEHPDRKIERIAPTLGVYIRDHYLAEHPEIN
jgi:hypothetical protein